MSVELLIEQYVEFLSLKGGCTGSSGSILVKMPHCWKSQVTAQIVLPTSLGKPTRLKKWQVPFRHGPNHFFMISGINCTDPDWMFYSGTVAVTDGGRTCQIWTEHTPHQHWLDEGYRFPNDNNSTENAVNYCRIPNEGDYPWCYTTDPHRRYQDCNNRICGGI